MGWYEDLVEDASKAVEVCGWDNPSTVEDNTAELEEFAAEWNKTPAGIEWAQIVSTMTWRIKN